MEAVTFALAVAPLAGALYLSTQDPRNATVEKTKKNVQDGGWVGDNVYHYLEQPISVPKVLAGDYDELAVDDPFGPVQRAMESHDNPVKQLHVLASYEMARDKYVSNLWKEFIGPRNSVTVRSVDQPMVQVHILKPGGAVDKQVKSGARYWDQPFPKQFGIDRFYPRYQPGPWWNIAH